MFELLQQRWPELLDKTVEHLLLTGVSTGIAVAVGVPLGIWILRQQRLRSVVMGVVSTLQTIPSLALLAFLLPLLGIGVRPALVALTLYALLPIVRNTLTALQTIPGEIREATDALGFTRRQRLWQVELPLAMPVIIAGIRTATVISVGIATLAAFIGAGGLGDFIVRGLATNNTGLILLGAVPAALLALLLDFVIAGIERSMASRHSRSGRRWQRVLSAGTFAVLLAVGLITMLLPDTARNNTIRIGSKNFTEQFILGEMLAQMLETHTDLVIERQLNLGSVTICHQAMRTGEIDIYPEYTGTAFRVILDRTDSLDAESTFTAVQQAYANDFQMHWLQPFGFNNTYAIAVLGEFARQQQISTISQLLPFSDTLTMGFASEFYERPDGYRGFADHYRIQFDDTAEMDIGLLYQATRSGRVDVIAGNATDGRIAAYDLQILADDQNYFPPYYAAPIIRQQVVDQHPEIVPILNRLAGTIDAQTMQRLNYAVDHDGESAYAVAQAFLIQQQLVPGR